MKYAVLHWNELGVKKVIAEFDNETDAFNIVDEMMKEVVLKYAYRHGEVKVIQVSSMQYKQGGDNNGFEITADGNIQIVEVVEL